MHRGCGGILQLVDSYKVGKKCSDPSPAINECLKTTLLLTPIFNWQNSAVFEFKFMGVPLNDQPTRRERVEREAPQQAKKSFTPFFTWESC